MPKNTKGQALKNKKRDFSEALSNKKAEVRVKRIGGQTNYIVGGHYFNDKAGAHHFAKTGKTLPGQEAR